MPWVCLERGSGVLDPGDWGCGEYGCGLSGRELVCPFEVGEVGGVVAVDTKVGVSCWRQPAAAPLARSLLRMDGESWGGSELRG